MIQRNLILVSLVASGALAGVGLAASAATDSNTIPALEAARGTLDKGLADRVENRLRSDLGLAGSRIRVESIAGIVTLQGGVPDNFARDRAMEVAAGVRGVREVRNELETGLPK
jgi:osmotically-inducible protein OsmY